MSRETAGEGALEAAVRRLDRALETLEARLGPGGPTDLFAAAEAGRAELERAAARTRELEAAGAEASRALGHAIDEIRLALSSPAPAEEG